MATLTSKQRAQLPDSAFAYIDSQREAAAADQRRVARAQRARPLRPGRVRGRCGAGPGAPRLLSAAKRYGIMPIGFISAQLEPQRKLPTGPGDVPARGHRGLDRPAARASETTTRRCSRTSAAWCAPPCGRRGGHEVSRAGTTCSPCSRGAGGARGRARDPARDAATTPGRGDASAAAHRPAPRAAGADRTGYVGLSVHAAARICFAAHGGQIVLSAAVSSALGKELPEGVGLKSSAPGASAACRSRSSSSRRGAGPAGGLPATAVRTAGAMTERVIAVDDPSAAHVARWSSATSSSPARRRRPSTSSRWTWTACRTPR